MYNLSLDNKLHLAPIDNPQVQPKPPDQNPAHVLMLCQKILDAGTGTGIWAIDMADVNYNPCAADLN